MQLLLELAEIFVSPAVVTRFRQPRLWSARFATVAGESRPWALLGARSAQPTTTRGTTRRMLALADSILSVTLDLAIRTRMMTTLALLAWRVKISRQSGTFCLAPPPSPRAVRPSMCQLSQLRRRTRFAQLARRALDVIRPTVFPAPSVGTAIRVRKIAPTVVWASTST